MEKIQLTKCMIFITQRNLKQFCCEHSRKTSGDWFKRFCREIYNLKIKNVFHLLELVKIQSLKGDLDILRKSKIAT